MVQLYHFISEGGSMRKFLPITLVLVALAGAVAPVQAEGGCWAGSYAAPCGIAYVNQVVTCYRTEWQEREVTYTVMRPTYREVVQPYKVTVCVPVYSTEKRKATVYENVA